eukprot:12564830-Alexandrium_andersonii.AAC.1
MCRPSSRTRTNLSAASKAPAARRPERPRWRLSGPLLAKKTWQTQGLAPSPSAVPRTLPKS